MDTNQTLDFIEDYRTRPCLWDVQDKDYSNKTKRNGVYAELGSKLGWSIKEVKNKIKSLRSYYAKEHNKVLDSEPDQPYEPQWFAYRALQFIENTVTPRLKGSGVMYENCDADEESSGAAEEILGNVKIEDWPFQTALGDNFASSKSRVVAADVSQTSQSKRSSEDESNHLALQPSTSTKSLKRRYEEDVGHAEEDVLPRTPKRVPKDFGIARDDSTVFGELVASQIGKLGDRNRAIARNRIQNVIFELEMAEMDGAAVRVSETS